jgi:hypothetical protein
MTFSLRSLLCLLLGVAATTPVRGFCIQHNFHNHRRPYNTVALVRILPTSALSSSPPLSESPYTQPSPGPPCVIKVIGVGGGGGNAVNRMIQTRIEGVSFWAINTDAQALAKSLAPNVLNIGRQLTRGLGAGGDPVVGKKAALENVLEMEHICDGADMIFITAGTYVDLNNRAYAVSLLMPLFVCLFELITIH